MRHTPAILLAALLFGVPPASADPLPPLPPQNLEATYDAATDSVTLTWEAPDAEHAYHYLVYRDGTQVADVTEPTFTETVQPGLSRYAILAARPSDGPGESAGQQHSAPIFGWILGGGGGCPIIILGFPGVALHPECLG